MTQQYDKVYIQDLRLKTIIGILPHERKQEQPVVLNITFSIPQHSASQTDCIADCPVNYAQARACILEFAANHQHQLIESFAEALIQRLINAFNCYQIELSVAKTDVFADASACGICITRKKHATHP